MPKQSEQIHATCIALDDTGILLLGDAGAGKSDLALRLIDEGAYLIADDRVNLRVEAGHLLASAPPALAGKIEVRGIGIVPLNAQNIRANARIFAAIRLTTHDAVPRMPEAEVETWAGIRVPIYPLAPFQAAASARVRILADGVRRGILPLP